MIQERRGYNPVTGKIYLSYYSDIKDPVELTQWAENKCPLDEIDTSCATFQNLQREVKALSRDWFFKWKLNRKLKELDSKYDGQGSILKSHMQRVGFLFENTLAQVFGKDAVKGFHLIGEYHDIGKAKDKELFAMSVSAKVFDDAEREKMKNHVFLSGFALWDKYPTIAAIVLGHHEFGQDPYRRASIHTDEPDWQCRTALRNLISVCDKADAWITTRTYRAAHPVDGIPSHMTGLGHSQSSSGIIYNLIPSLNRALPL